MISIFPSEIIFENLTLRNFTCLEREKLLEILSCRNHDSVRLQMYNKGIILPHAHLEFVIQIGMSKEACFFGVYIDSLLIGVCSLQVSFFKKSAIGGLYKNPFLEHKMIGSKTIGEMILESLIHVSFKHLNLHKLSLEVYENNFRAKALYERMGFKIKGNLTKNIVIYEKFSS